MPHLGFPSAFGGGVDGVHLDGEVVIGVNGLDEQW